MTLDAFMIDAQSVHAETKAMLTLLHDLYPICRSITGDGVRATLARIGREIPLEVHEVPTGTQVFDWEIPEEWNIRDAYIADSSGRRLIDFRQHNLHVMGYSVAVNARMSIEDLRPHLHSDTQRPDAIPYRTSYWRRDWAFCLSDRQLQSIGPGPFDVMIDSTLSPGSLTYAECLIRGASSQEILISTHVCHPSLANDNCSGMAVAARLAALIAGANPRLTYRFLFAPGTIGAITWLARNEQRLDRIRAGLVIGLLGDSGPLTYKRSRRGDSEIDRIAADAIHTLDPQSARIVPFSPYGYDERQFCAPGINLPVGRLTRSANDEYPEYHSSGDNLGIVSGESMLQSLTALTKICCMIDGNERFLNLHPKGEPRLGKHGLFRDLGGRGPADLEQAVLWMLSQSDGSHGIADIAAASSLDADLLRQAATRLQRAGLIRNLD